MRFVAIIMCDDDMYYGARKTINSLRYFHPDVEIVRYGTKEIRKLKIDYNLDDGLTLSDSCLVDDYIKNHDFPDVLLKLGADNIALDRFDEVLDDNYDVACARNDPDQVGDRDERHNRPDIIRDIPNWEWVNADFVAIKNPAFAKAFHDQNIKYMNSEEWALKDFGKTYRGDGMCSLNIPFRLGGFKTKILDPRGSSLIYGSSGNWGGGHGESWSSWKDVYFDGKNSVMPDGGRGTGDRIVKCLHQGGGYRPDKLDYNLFNSKFRERLLEVTGF